MSVAFTFPGQGSQAVGMGKALADAFDCARAVFAEVDDALGEHLSKTMWEGPKDVLTLTQNAQPALMAVSLAACRVLEIEKGIQLEGAAKFVAGHSLGEYSALAAAGTFSVSDAARLLRTRGQAMQQAVPVGEGAMAAMLGLDLEPARALAAAAAEGDVCEVANDNAPGQVVLSGSASAVARAVKLAPEHGARRAVLLDVSAPFHCRLMAPAADVMAEALAAVPLNPPRVPLVANVTAEPLSEPDQIRQRLIEQVTGTVRWRECISYLAGAGVTDVYEIGAGRVLSGLVRRIDGNLTAHSIGQPEEIDKAVATLTAVR